MSSAANDGARGGGRAGAAGRGHDRDCDIERSRVQRLESINKCINCSKRGGNERGVNVSKGFYQRLMLVRSMMSGCDVFFKVVTDTGVLDSPVNESDKGI